MEQLRRINAFVNGPPMVRSSIYLLSAGVLISLSGMANASAQNCDVKSCPQVMGTDIVRLIEGKLLTPSMRYQQVAPPAGEWFGVDHQWHASLQSFSLTQISGTWDVEGDLVCVSRELKPKFCRAIWRNQRSGEISMPMVPDWSREDGAIIVDMVDDTWGPKG